MKTDNILLLLLSLLIIIQLVFIWEMIQKEHFDTFKDTQRTIIYEHYDSQAVIFFIYTTHQTWTVNKHPSWNLTVLWFKLKRSKNSYQELNSLCFISFLPEHHTPGSHVLLLCFYSHSFSPSLYFSAVHDPPLSNFLAPSVPLFQASLKLCTSSLSLYHSLFSVALRQAISVLFTHCGKTTHYGKLGIWPCGEGTSSVIKVTLSAERQSCAQLKGGGGLSIERWVQEGLVMRTLLGNS